MDLAERVAVLERRLATLEDREAIRNAIAGYGPMVDAGDSGGAARSWTTDGRYDVDGMGISQGHDALRALFDGDVHQALISEGAAHIISPVHITINGSEAVATGYSCVFQWRETGFEASRVAANRWRLRRDGEHWLVVERVNRLLNGSAEARRLLDARRNSQKES